MSAIAGIYYLDGRFVEQNEIEQILTSLAHRGHDASHLWCEGAIALGRGSRFNKGLMNGGSI